MSILPSTYKPPVNISPHEGFLGFGGFDFFLSRIAKWLSPKWATYSPEGTFLLQSWYQSYYRHRLRLPYYILAGFTVPLTYAHLKAWKQGPPTNGTATYALVKSDMYNLYHSIPGHETLGHRYQWQKHHPFPMQIYSASAPTWKIWSWTDRYMKTPTEIAAEDAAIVKHFQHDLPHDPLRFKAQVNRALDFSAEFLPVGHCEKTNNFLFEKVCEGIKHAYQGNPAASKAAFAHLEKAHWDAAVNKSIPVPTDGTLSLRYAYKRAQLDEYDWRKPTRKFWRATVWGHLWRNELWDYRFQRAPWWWAGATFVGLGFLLFAREYDQAVLRNDAKFLAKFGAHDDTRSFAERLREVEHGIQLERETGKFMYRDPGWLNGFASFRPGKFQEWNCDF